MKKKKVSIGDIAKSLGVSKTLVSMVINNLGDQNGISKATQKRVWEKVKEMNYVPNQLARGLRLGRTNTIGLIVSDISNSFYANIARHVEDFAAKKGYNLIICSTDENEDKEVRLIRMLMERQVDGLIISTSQQNGDEIKNLLKANYPFVLIDRNFPKIKANSVTVDNLEGAYEGVIHLVNQGYKKITAFAITPIYVSTIHERIEGYKKALREHMLGLGYELLSVIPFNDIKGTIKKELDRLLKDKNEINAIFAVNNRIAIACLECLKEMKIRVPQDIAVLCFDDRDFFSLNAPSLTAIAQPIEEIAENAINLLLDDISDKDRQKSKRQVVLNTKLVVRESSAHL